jgi:hypothetical protein
MRCLGVSTPSRLAGFVKAGKLNGSGFFEDISELHYLPNHINTTRCLQC